MTQNILTREQCQQAYGAQSIGILRAIHALRLRQANGRDRIKALAEIERIEALAETWPELNAAITKTEEQTIER